MIAEQAERKLEATREEGAQDPAHRPLQGIRVVDLTHVLAGPLCTTIMADLGADVVKVERLGAGDITRQEEPFREEESCYFAALNRNKRSLALDLKRDEARLALERLVERADVLVENFRPGTLDSLGFGYDRLLQLNPGLVICSISGFGQTGPLRDYKAFDLVAQAMTGLMTLTREPGGPPLRILIGDILTGVYGALSVASALVGRVKSGKGCVIDLSLFESLLTTFPYFAVRYLTDGELPPPIDAGQNAVPYDVFPASDGELVIAIYGDHMWPSLCRVLDLPDARRRCRTQDKCWPCQTIEGGCNGSYRAIKSEDSCAMVRNICGRGNSPRPNSQHRCCTGSSARARAGHDRRVGASKVRDCESRR
ncbi:crotonobetainyl-CoA:carnitine CoA-transferase CaiB-like acyl-CoA transferase [Bradyrhizobium sp. LM6.11]